MYVTELSEILCTLFFKIRINNSLPPLQKEKKKEEKSVNQPTGDSSCHAVLYIQAEGRKYFI